MKEDTGLTITTSNHSKTLLLRAYIELFLLQRAAEREGGECSGRVDGIAYVYCR